MDTIELEARTKLAINLGDMAALMIKREPPFANLQPPDEVTPFLFQKYLEYFDEIDESVKQSILNMFIDYSRGYYPRSSRSRRKDQFQFEISSTC